MDKHWVTQAVDLLQASRQPVPHELNELDWKMQLSENKERLAQHLIAFANHSNGGNLVFGVAEPDASLVGITPEQVADIVVKSNFCCKFASVN